MRIPGTRRSRLLTLLSLGALTVVVGLPKGVLHPPGPLRELGWFLEDNLISIAALLVPVLAFAGMLALYLQRGRDPDVGSSVAV